MIGTCQVSISGDVAPFNKTWALKTCLIDFYSVSKILMHQGEKMVWEKEDMYFLVQKL